MSTQPMAQNTQSLVEEFKNTLEWGTYGKGGFEHCGGLCPEHQLKVKKLVDCDTEHLQAILRTQQQVWSHHYGIYASVIISILDDRGVEPESFSLEAAQEQAERYYAGVHKFRGGSINA